MVHNHTGMEKRVTLLPINSELVSDASLAPFWASALALPAISVCTTFRDFGCSCSKNQGTLPV